jgi:hypothetical protein
MTQYRGLLVIGIPNGVEEAADSDIPGEEEWKKPYNVENDGQQSSGISRRCLADVLVPFGKYRKTRMIKKSTYHKHIQRKPV